MSKKITKALINATKSGDKEILLLDAEVKGFGVRVTPNGSKSFFVRFRLGRGRDAPVRKPTIAKVDEMTVDQAREIARNWKANGKQGVDAGQIMKEEAQEPTVSKLCTQYMEHHGNAKRSANNDAAFIEKFVVPILGRIRVKDVTHAHIGNLHRTMKDTPYQANRVLSLLSKMFGLAVRWRWIEANPAQGVQKFAEEKRERFLSQNEVTRLNDALNDYVAERRDHVARDAADAIRLLLLTGCRSGELLAATWDQFDIEAGVWRKPSSHTKSKKVHRVRLSAPAVTILEAIKGRRDLPGRWVFPGVNGQHRRSLRAAWADLRLRAGIEDVRIHDLRHTAASLMLSAGVPLDHVGQVLGHTQAQTTLRYAHLSDEASKAATDKLGEVLQFRRNHRGD